jgi:hypothetical protein
MLSSLRRSVTTAAMVWQKLACPAFCRVAESKIWQARQRFCIRAHVCTICSVGDKELHKGWLEENRKRFVAVGDGKAKI